MKRILVGFLASIGFISIMIITAFVWNAHKLTLLMEHDAYEPEKIGNTTVLKVKLGSTLLPDNPTAQSFIVDLLRPSPLSLFEMTQTIKAASNDDRIKGIFLEFEGTTVSLSQAQELRSVFQQFRDTGKFIYAFAYTFGEGSNSTVAYYLATAATKIFMQPQGHLSITGLMLENFFYKELFEKWDITAQFDQRENYKGLFEMFTKTKFSDETRSNLQSIVNDLTSQISDGIATARNLKAVDVKEILDNAPYLDEEAVTKKLIDQLLHRQEVEQEIIKEVGTTPDYITAPKYAQTLSPIAAKESIALVFVDGGINSATSSNTDSQDENSPRHIARFIQAAVEDETVKAIVLRINSPGGVVSGAQTIWFAAQQVKLANKPLIVSMGSYAASAGYMIAAPATTIVATPATITGSIGVASGKFAIDKTIEKLGVSHDKIMGSKNADFWSLADKFSPAQWQKLQAELDSIYQNFMGKVAVGRGKTVEEVRKVAQGQVWSGKQAIEKGLVDSLGGLDDAITIAKEKAGLKEDENVSLKVMNTSNRPFSLMSLLSSQTKILMAAVQERLNANRIQQKYSYGEIS